MKRQLLFFLITIVSLNCYSQISFEKGYFINNSGQKVNCLIKNIDWKNNPIEFQYKLSENTEIKKATIKSVKEFGINKISKYVRHIVNIDRSSDIINRMSTVKKPVFKEEQLYLKILVEGKSNLYLFEDGNLKRYFYSNHTNLKQLIHKKYKTHNNRIGENNGFRQQLFTDLKCQDISINDVKNLAYKKNELIKFFVKYSKCHDQEFNNLEEKQKRDFFDLTIRLGLNNSSLTIENGLSDSKNTNFGNKSSIRLGIETEFILPFNKNKWAFTIEPTYQYYNSKKERVLYPNTLFEKKEYVKTNYNSIELPFGIKYYLFLNDDSKIFINGSFIVDLSRNSKIDFESGPDLEIDTTTNLAFGLGYKYKKKYSLEIRQQTSRKILGNYIFWNSDYNTFSIILGYSIL